MFDWDDLFFWGGFFFIFVFIGCCFLLIKLKMIVFLIQWDWYFILFISFCFIWRDLYGGYLCIYKGNKSVI